MRNLFIYSLLLLPEFIFSQDFSNEAAKDSITICYINTIDKTKLKGKLITENAEQITVLDLTLGEVSISKKKIKNFSKEKPNSIFEIQLVNGNTVNGKIISIDRNRWLINNSSLGQIDIKSSDIMDFYPIDVSEQNSKYDFVNIDPGRYFAGPAPFSLKRNRAVFQNTELLINGVSYGLGSNFTISAGVIYLYLPYLHIKYALELSQNFHFSVGVMAVGFPFFSNSSDAVPVDGAPYTQIAIGNLENNVSIGAYYPYFGSFLSNGHGFERELSFSLAGIKRLNDHLSIMAEDYNVPYSEYRYGYYPSYQGYYTTRYVNAGAVGLKIFMKKYHGSGTSILNAGMCWIANSDIGRRGSFIAFPILGYSTTLTHRDRARY